MHATITTGVGRYEAGVQCWRDGWLQCYLDDCTSYVDTGVVWFLFSFVFLVPSCSFSANIYIISCHFYEVLCILKSPSLPAALVQYSTLIYIHSSVVCRYFHLSLASLGVTAVLVDFIVARLGEKFATPTELYLRNTKQKCKTCRYAMQDCPKGISA